MNRYYKMPYYDAYAILKNPRKGWPVGVDCCIIEADDIIASISDPFGRLFTLSSDDHTVHIGGMPMISSLPKKYIYEFETDEEAMLFFEVKDEE